MWDLIVLIPDHCLSVYSDQTGQRSRLLSVLVGSTFHFVGFDMM